MLQDLRFGLRGLAKAPGFTFLAVLTLALGIGATAAMYSVLYAVVLDPFPYKDIDSLMSIVLKGAGDRFGSPEYTVDQYVEIAERNSVFDNVTASTIDDVVWTGAGAPQRLRGNHVSMNTFVTMGVPPLLGRVITPDDSKPGAEPIAILGYKFWIRQFGGDPRVIGRHLHLNDKIRTVVGVMPPRFMWRGADVYLPTFYRPGETPEGVRDVFVLGRLKPGITQAQAATALRPILEDLARQNPTAFHAPWTIRLRSFRDIFSSGITGALWALFAAVGLLLIIACVNVSGLLLSRSAVRRREMAVRSALGASRSRLIRQLLSESLLLALIGGIFGIIAAAIGLRGIIAMVPPDTIPDEAHIALNVPVLIFTFVVCVAAAVFFGMAPALQISRKDVAVPLREAGRGTTASGQRLLRNALVVCQVALSLILLVGASAMVRSLLTIYGFDLGVRPDHMLALRVPLSEQRYPDQARRIAFFQQLLSRVQALPGVVAAGVNTGLYPFGDRGVHVLLPGFTRPDSRFVLLHQSSEGYLKVVPARLNAGRLLTTEDINDKRHVAVVNDAFGKRYFAGRFPLAKTLELADLRTPAANLSNIPFEIVGVVRDSPNQLEIMQFEGDQSVIPEIYIPYTLTADADTLAVQSQVNASALANSVRAQVYAIDSQQPVTDLATVSTLLSQYVYARPRFNLLLLTTFAVIGLTMAVFGVYGVLSTFVSQRTQEIGVRMALGADFTRIIGMILSMGGKLLFIGIAIGLIGSIGALRLLSSQVWTASSFDLTAFIAAALLLLASGITASFWVARRAATIDPVRALRIE